MKKISYQICTMVNYGTKEEPLYEKVLTSVKIPWNEVNEEIAKREAYNGEYTIEDDGQPEAKPSQMDIIEAQVAYTAMMTDTLLEV